MDDPRSTFSGRIALLAAAARTFNNTLEAQQATWEPHDWDDF